MELKEKIEFYVEYLEKELHKTVWKIEDPGTSRDMVAYYRAKRCAYEDAIITAKSMLM